MLSLDKENIRRQIKEHKDIIVFMLVIVSFHAFWKIGREADDTQQLIHFYGVNFSSFFTFISEIWANLVYRFVFLFKGELLELQVSNLHYADTDTGMSIIWGCSGVKEALMTALVIISAKGSYLKKIVYIPLGMFAVLLLNYIRLVSILFLVHHHPEMFDFVHGILFRVIMYGGIFLVWLGWTEKVSKKEFKLFMFGNRP